MREDPGYNATLKKLLALFKFEAPIGGAPVRWYDREGIVKVEKPALLATIELATRGTFNQYEGFLVTIVSRTCGKLTSHYFSFDDYLRKGEPNCNGSGCAFEIYPSGIDGWRWSEHTPKDVRPFVDAVNRYLKEWA